MKRILLSALLATTLLACLTAYADPPETVNLRKTVVVEVVARSKAAIVNISATRIISQRVSPFGDDPFFQQFGIGEVAKVPSDSLGSGFIIHADGYVITNNHVVDRARQINVELEDGRKLPAELISADPDADLAVLKISDAHAFPTLELGDSSDLMIGEPAIAVGNPLGFSHSVSTGIVSALHRDLNDSSEPTALKNLIQTDAAINPGNSGGPLLNAYGQVIGINTAIRSDAQNIGFAIPVNRLREMIPELMDPAAVRKVALPIKLTERREITEPANVKCQVVTVEKSPRVVRRIDGKKPANIVDAYDLLLRLRPGQTLTVEYTDGKSDQFTATATPTPDAIMQAKSKLGLAVEALTPMLAEKYHLNVEEGIFIDGVDSDSVGARAGLKAGDILVQIGHFRISSLNDFSALLDRLPARGHVRIGVVRDEQIETGTLDFSDGT